MRQRDLSDQDNYKTTLRTTENDMDRKRQKTNVKKYYCGEKHSKKKDERSRGEGEERKSGSVDRVN